MRVLRKMAGLVLGTAALAAASPAYADIQCAFSISAIGLDTSGNFVPTLTNGGNTYSWYICSTQGTVVVNNGYGANANVTSGACNALYSQFLTARASGQPITMWFHGPTACSVAGGLPASQTWISAQYPTIFLF